MSDEVIFHLDEANIKEDLEYYTTDVRDKHNQIKPSDGIRSLTPLPSGVGSFLAPIEPYSLNRLYLGVSMPLFSNRWGAAFLRELLKLIKPQGSVILPVYPEAEAADKAYWCRSALEDIFRSRQRWTGFSNVNAENDGVMSMRVGRKWPDEITSTACWMMRGVAQTVLSETLEQDQNTESTPQRFFELTGAAWHSGIVSAICERVLQDYFGRKARLTVCEADGHGFLAAELCHPKVYPVVEQADVIVERQDIDSIKRIHNNLPHFCECEVNVREISTAGTYDAVFVNIAGTRNRADIEPRILEYWNMVAPGGILIVRTADEPCESLNGSGAGDTYYSYAALRIDETRLPTHYSATMSDYINRQSKDKKAVLQVFAKPAT